MPYDDVNEVANELFESLFSRYQISLETSRGRCDFTFDTLQKLYYKYCIINFKRGGWYIDSQDRIKKKRETINLKNEDI